MIVPSTEKPRQSSASWVSATTNDKGAINVEVRLLGKQAEVGGEVYGGGESGQKVKATRIHIIYLQAAVVTTYSTSFLCNMCKAMFLTPYYNFASLRSSIQRV